MNETSTTATERHAKRRTVSQWATLLTVTTTLSAIFLYYLGHSYTIGWLERAGLPPNLFPVSFHETVVAGGHGASLPILELLLSRLGLLVVVSFAFISVGTILFSLVAAFFINIVWRRWLRERALHCRNRWQRTKIHRFARLHRLNLSQLGTTVGWLFAYPFVLYGVALTLGILYVFSTVGMHTAGRSAAERLLSARYQELQNPVECEGTPRIRWQRPNGDDAVGMHLTCGASVCGVVSEMGVETVALEDIESIRVPCERGGEAKPTRNDEVAPKDVLDKDNPRGAAMDSVTSKTAD